MSNVSHFRSGPLSKWSQWSFKHPALDQPAPGKLFLGEKLGLSGMEVSLNSLGPGIAVPFYHRHRRHEELYLILSGRGEFQVDGEYIEVAEGSALRIAPAGARTWRNTGQEPLIYLVIQAAADSLEHQGIDDGEVLDRPVVW